MKKILSLTMILIFSTGIFPGCKKDKGQAPELPPMESMTIDFSNFSLQKKSVDFIYNQKGAENSNWEFAASVAGMWNLIVSTTLAVPIATFKLAITNAPVYLSEKTWQWSYSATVLTVVYNARLTGEIRTSDVLWKMFISKEGNGGFTDFLWFEGTSKLDGTGGQWKLYQSYQSPGAILQIDWTKSGNSIGTVKYTYVKNPDPFRTSFIEYGLTSGALNAYYTIHYYNGLKFSDVNVEWNTTTHNGRLKCFDYLGDDSWYCWDTNKINAICQ